MRSDARKRLERDNQPHHDPEVCRLIEQARREGYEAGHADGAKWMSASIAALRDEARAAGMFQ